MIDVIPTTLEYQALLVLVIAREITFRVE